MSGNWLVKASSFVLKCLWAFNSGHQGTQQFLEVACTATYLPTAYCWYARAIMSPVLEQQREIFAGTPPCHTTWNCTYVPRTGTTKFSLERRKRKSLFGSLRHWASSAFLLLPIGISLRPSLPQKQKGESTQCWHACSGFGFWDYQPEAFLLVLYFWHPTACIWL